MTGYGRVSHSFLDKTIKVEIRSLNSKFTDIRVKIPHNYKDKENEVRKLLSDKLYRGKIDLNIEIASFTSNGDYGLNTKLFKRYYRELNALAEELELDNGGLMEAILKLPNVVVTDENEIDEKEWKEIMKALSLGIEKFHNFRLEEGKAMEKDLILRTKNIRSLLQQVDPYEKERVVNLRSRLHQKLEDFVGKDKIDENRFEQESSILPRKNGYHRRKSST